MRTCVPFTSLVVFLLSAGLHCVKNKFGFNDAWKKRVVHDIGVISHSSEH